MATATKKTPDVNGRIIPEKNRIIIEAYLDSDSTQGGLIDYKNVCFHGKASFLYVVADRVLGQGAGFGIFDRAFKQLKVTRLDEKPLERKLNAPPDFDKMLAVAETLSKPFPHARID